MSKGKILFQLSGSIACFKACQVISQLVQRGYEVETVASTAALRFIGEATLEGLTGRRVHSEVFAAGQYMQHIHLIRWADVVVLCPATARTINSLARGTGESLISALFLAHDFQKPYLLAPAMNASMLAHPSTTEALAKIKSWGVKVLAAAEGNLACGEVGSGRLLEPVDLLREIESAFAPPVVAAPLKVLITAGGTREPIDGVRAITNTSSGNTAVTIAEHFQQAGHQVTLIRASDSRTPSLPVTRQLTFTTFNDLKQAMENELREHEYDAVVHAAAVSDFSLAAAEIGGKRFLPKQKLESSEKLTLHLKSNPKLIDEIKSYTRNPNVKVVGFKLTNGATERERELAVQRLLDHSHVDFVVQNDLTEITSTGHRSRLFDTRQKTVSLAESATKAELAEALRTTLELAVKEGAK